MDFTAIVRLRIFVIVFMTFKHACKQFAGSAYLVCALTSNAYLLKAFLFVLLKVGGLAMVTVVTANGSCGNHANYMVSVVSVYRERYNSMVTAQIATVTTLVST